MNRALIAAAILGAGLVSGGMLIQGVVFREADAASATPRLLEQVMERLRRDYIDTISTEQMLRLAALGVPQEVDERYSKLLTPERAERLRRNSIGQASVGLEVDIRDGFVVVIAPLAGTPADSAGIEPGDVLVSINGATTYGLTMEEIERALHGPAGSQVELGIDRDDESRSFKLTRRPIVARAVRRAVMIAPGIEYVKLATINADAASELRRAVEAHPRKDALILDLRENPGGQLQQALGVADLFLDDGQKIVGTRGRTPDDNRDYVDRARQPWPTLPIVVLVDSGTASAAEVVAGALKDNGRAVLVGSPTYGKGSAQSLLPTTGGYVLRLTTARWLTPRGRVIERDSTGGGIEPDIVTSEAGGGRREGQDPQLKRAIELLRGVKTLADLRARVPAKPAKSAN
ncbi:MAG: S41 family peptidase [Gemmatimonadaceae bacterium]